MTQTMKERGKNGAQVKTFVHFSYYFGKIV